MKKFLKRYDYIVKYKGNSFIETIFFAIVLIVICFLFGISHTKAISNIGQFADLTIAENGAFYSLSSSAATNKNYTILKYSTYYYAMPSNSSWTYGTYGGSLVQCGMSFLKDNYYSVTYVFNFNSSNMYLHPYYTSYQYRLGVGESEISTTLNSNWESVNSRSEYFTPVDFETHVGSMVGSFTVIFKAPANGTCVNLAFSSSDRKTYAEGVAFLGYKYQNLGSKALTEAQIQNALNSSFNDVKNSINNKIDNSTNSINNNINDMKDKQDVTNNKLDEINNADISSSDKELPNTDSYDNYQESEGALLDKVKEANFDNLSIGMDLDSSNFVWSTLSSLIQSHSAVFGMFIAILSIGIIKLALGR